MNTEVENVFLPNEVEQASKLLTEIRFDCLVTLYDYGQITPKVSMPFLQRKPLPPQYFKLNQALTLDFIRTANEWEIGKVIKDSYMIIQNHIKQYEKQTTTL